MQMTNYRANEMSTYRPSAQEGVASAFRSGGPAC